MKMTMHIDEDTLREVMKITGAPSKTAAVEMALKELARKAKLKALLRRGTGLKGKKLEEVFFPGFFENFYASRNLPLPPLAVAEGQAPYGKRRPRR